MSANDAMSWGKRSAEDPTKALTWDLLAESAGIIGSESYSGVNINNDSALTYDAVWRAVNLISKNIAKINLFVYKREGEGGKVRAPNHPAYTLLLRKPSNEMNAFTFKEVLTSHALMHGNGYAHIFRDSSTGRPKQLIIMNPTGTWPVRKDGVLYYVTMVDGELRKITHTEVLHLKGLGFDGLIGYSVLTKARNSLGHGLAIGEHGGRFFANSARPAVTLEHPKTLSAPAAEKLRNSWNKMYAGLSNAHKTAVLEEGLKANVISATNEEAQFIESRKFSVREVSNWFGVPPHMLGDDAKSSFASIADERQGFLDNSLDPWLCMIEAECWDKLLTEQQKKNDSHLVEFNREAYVKMNFEQKMNGLTTAVGGAPVMTINEARSKLNMNPLDDEQYNELIMPSNNFESDPVKLDVNLGKGEEEKSRKRLRITRDKSGKMTGAEVENAID